MTQLTTTKLAGATLLLAALGGCAATHVDPADRDTTGSYDGSLEGYGCSAPIRFRR